MRKLTLVLLLAFLVPTLVVSADRAAGTYAIGGFGGLGMPMKPEFVKDYFKKGIGFGGQFQYNLSPQTSLALAFTYMPFKFDVDKLMEGGLMKAAEMTVEGGNLNYSIISANLVQYFTPPAASMGFFGTLGAGYYMGKFSDMTIKFSDPVWGDYEETTKGESENDIGINGGIGLEFKAGQTMNIFVKGLYHYVFTSEDEETDSMAKASAEDSDTEGKLQFITIMGGVSLSL